MAATRFEVRFLRMSVGKKWLRRLRGFLSASRGASRSLSKIETSTMPLKQFSFSYAFETSLGIKSSALSDCVTYCCSVGSIEAR
jgi:hypothetical protein